MAAECSFTCDLQLRCLHIHFCWV